MTGEDKKDALRAMCLTNLGEVHRLSGHCDKARKYLDESLKIKENIYGSGHLEIATTVENLGNVFFDLEEYHDAQENYERALTIKRSKLSKKEKENPDIAQTLNNLGNVAR